MGLHTVFVNVVKIDAVKATLKRHKGNFDHIFCILFPVLKNLWYRGVSSKIYSVIMSFMKIGAEY
jgi:hypothetical protein